MEKRKYRERAEYLKKYVTEKRRKLKIDSINYKGGRCQSCGYNKCKYALQFHHIDPKEKDFRISSGRPKKWERIKIELDKTILLCSNCHFEEHERLFMMGNSQVGKAANCFYLPSAGSSPASPVFIGSNPVWADRNRSKHD